MLEIKEDAVYHTLWGSCFGGVYGPVSRQTVTQITNTVSVVRLAIELLLLAPRAVHTETAEIQGLEL